MAKDEAALENARVDLRALPDAHGAGRRSRGSSSTRRPRPSTRSKPRSKSDQGQIDAREAEPHLQPHHRARSPAASACASWTPGNMVHATDANGLARHHAAAADRRRLHDPGGPAASRAGAAARGPHARRRGVRPRPQERKLATGTLSAVDNQIDPTTGTVRLKALVRQRRRRALSRTSSSTRGCSSTRCTPSSWCRTPRSSAARSRTFVYVVEAGPHGRDAPRARCSSPKATTSAIAQGPRGRRARRRRRRRQAAAGQRRSRRRAGGGGQAARPTGRSR